MIKLMMSLGPLLLELIVKLTGLAASRQASTDKISTQSDGAAIAENATLNVVNGKADEQAKLDSAPAVDPLTRAGELRARADAANPRGGSANK